MIPLSKNVCGIDATSASTFYIGAVDLESYRRIGVNEDDEYIFFVAV